MSHYRIIHITQYFFEQFVTQREGQVILAPRNTEWQHVEYSQLVFRPMVAKATDFDTHGNQATHFNVSRGMRRFNITVFSTVTTGLKRREARDQYDIDSYRQHLLLTHNDELVAEFASSQITPEYYAISAAANLCRLIPAHFTYDPSSTQVTTAAAEALRTGRGVYQGYAHVAIAGQRTLGFTAHYVSRYMDTASSGRETGVSADLSHAWFSVYCPHAAGWT